MMGKPFINLAVSKAIENYLKYKGKLEEPMFSTFPVFVIRTLIYIYGELDIINPYITQNEHNMGGFDSNLAKYGFSLDKIQDFKNQFLVYEQELSLNKVPNTAFLKIEKYLIEMYFCKQKTMRISVDLQEEFKTYLYLPENSNPFIQQELNRVVLDKNELSLYFNSLAFEANHNFSIEELRRNTLVPEAYTLLGYSLDQINTLSDVDLRNVNNQIYAYFRVNANLPDRDDYLQKAINYYKKYGNRVTSGNGYVDFLLFASVFATAIFILILVFFNR